MVISSRTKNTALWCVISTYVLCLPYAIWVFNALIDRLSLPVARWVPVVVIALLIVCYFLFCRWQRRGYHFITVIVPGALLALLALVLQSNPIKHIHLPEYAFLGLLIWLAQGRPKTILSYLSIWSTVVLLGIFDELHQGWHPERYFGWRDIVINGIGGLFGVLLIRAFSDNEEHCSLWPKRDTKLNNSVLTTWIVITVASLSVSLIYLLKVQEAGQFHSVFPSAIVMINALLTLTGVVLLFRVSSNLIRVPMLVLCINHLTVLVLALNRTAFL